VQKADVGGKHAVDARSAEDVRVDMYAVVVLWILY
jgi:hypothetical protein